MTDPTDEIPTLHHCNTCGADKTSDHFYRYTARKSGYAAHCKDCARIKSADYYQRNRERTIEHVRAHRVKNNAVVTAGQRARYYRDREEILEKMREHYAANRERIIARTKAYYEANKEKHHEQGKRWIQNNPEKNRDRYMRGLRKRRAQKANNARIPYTDEQLLARLRYYGGSCWICTAPGVEVDHVKPVSKGGPEMLANLRPICRPCNAQKSNKWPFSP